MSYCFDNNCINKGASMSLAKTLAILENFDKTKNS